MVALLSLSGCATTSKDPLEGINRGVYKFNDVADRYAMKPVAKAYKAVTPSPVRTGINNFFSNLGTLTTVVNDLLQLKFAQAFTDAGRFVINSTFGLAGLVDVASMDKIEKHNEDFGQTLGFWGLGSGPYLVLPILGPSSLRDITGLIVDTATSDPITYFHNIGEIRTHNQIRLAQLIDRRTQLLDATDLVDNASIDPYAFMRDAYLQRRASLVQDGLVPKELIQDEFEPADPEPAEQKVETLPVLPVTNATVENTYPPVDESNPVQTVESISVIGSNESAAALVESTASTVSPVAAQDSANQLPEATAVSSKQSGTTQHEAVLPTTSEHESVDRDTTKPEQVQSNIALPVADESAAIIQPATTMPERNEDESAKASDQSDITSTSQLLSAVINSTE